MRNHRIYTKLRMRNYYPGALFLLFGAGVMVIIRTVGGSHKIIDVAPL